MDRVIVCPNSEKLKILSKLSSDKQLYNIKFITKKEYLDNYYFSYGIDAIYYLMNKYNFNIDVCKVYLDNLYVIDINKEYKSSKLRFLKDIKVDLINNKLLKFNKYFKKYIDNKEIEVINYYDLDKYEEKALNYKVNVENRTIKTCVYQFNTMEEEVNYVCLEIIKLLNRGIDINKIFLTNVSSDYFYTLRKIFSYYKIPINIDSKDSIYSTKVVNDYLKNKELQLEREEYLEINKKLVSVINELSFIDENDPLYNTIFIDRLKNTYINTSKYKNSINIKDMFRESFDEDEYVFVLGFNQDILPNMKKDINYIADSIKEEVDMYQISYLNKREKDVVTYLLSNIKNLYLSYKLSTPFSSFYPSSLINDLGLEVIKEYKDNYAYSNFYNKIRLASMLDNYYLYGEKDDYLEMLNSNYNISYNTYSNTFNGINSKIKDSLQLSYTSLNTYNECKFKYYIKNILKLDDFKDNFSSFIGSMYHKILSLYRNSNFDLEVEYNNYLETRELNLKEKLLLVKIKKDLIKLIEVLKKQQLITGYDLEYNEKKFEITFISDDVTVRFIGYIDKIMYYKNVEDIYYSIIDYKTGYIDTHIEPMKYGLHMQLPVYLYLIRHSNEFKNSIFTGIYYQNILFNYPTWSMTLDKDISNRYLLNGYSSSDISILGRFDSTFYDSNYIKSMKYSDEKGFGTYSKVFDNDTLDRVISYTENYIEDRVSDIINYDFSIDPKMYNLKNISCEFCNFKDLCFMREKDLVYLDKVDDLSFLGGDD